MIFSLPPKNECIGGGSKKDEWVKVISAKAQQPILNSADSSEGMNIVACIFIPSMFMVR